MGDTFKKELDNMSSAWSDAPESSDLPEGTYTMTINSAEIRRTKNSGKLRATFQFTVSEGEHIGASQFDGYMLDPESPMGMSMLKQLLSQKLNYEIPENLSDLEELLADISNKNPIVTAEIVRKGDFTNVRVLELLTGAAPAVKTNPTSKKTSKKVETEEEAEEAEEAGEEEEAEEVELKVGSEVTFTVEDEEVTGKITKKNKNGTFNIETDTDIYEDVEASDLSPADGEEAEAAEEEIDEDDKKDELLLLAQSHDIAVEDTMTGEELQAELGQYEWKKSELTDEEIELLEGCEIAIIDDKAKKPLTKKPAPAPVSKGKPAAKPLGRSMKKNKK